MSKKKKFKRPMSADEFIELNTDIEPHSYRDMANIVIQLANEVSIEKMIPWFSYLSAGIQAAIEKDKYSRTQEDIAFNYDPIIRCFLDTLVQRAGGIASWDSGDAGWGQLYAIESGTKSEPCAGQMGYMMSLADFKREEAEQNLEKRPELYDDDEYDGGPGCLNSGPAYLDEMSKQEDKRS